MDSRLRGNDKNWSWAARNADPGMTSGSWRDIAPSPFSTYPGGSCVARIAWALRMPDPIKATIAFAALGLLWYMGTGNLFHLEITAVAVGAYWAIHGLIWFLDRIEPKSPD